MLTYDIQIARQSMFRGRIADSFPLICCVACAGIVKDVIMASLCADSKSVCVPRLIGLYFLSRFSDRLGNTTTYSMFRCQTPSKLFERPRLPERVQVFTESSMIILGFERAIFTM